MRFRLTYSFGDEKAYTVDLTTDKEDFLGAVEEAIDYIEKEHSSAGVLKIREFKILMMGGDGDGD